MSPADNPLTRWRWWLGHLVWIGLIAGVYFGVRAWQQHGLATGPAPALPARFISGETFDLADTRDRPQLVYFWATWCPVCRMEQGSIESVAQDHPVISIALQSGTAEEIAQYLDENRLRVPVINDPDGAIAGRWGVRVTPTLFFVDRGGRIRFRETGYTSEAGMRLRLWYLSGPGA